MSAPSERLPRSIQRMKHFLGKSLGKLPKEACEDLLDLITASEEYLKTETAPKEENP